MFFVCFWGILSKAKVVTREAMEAWALLGAVGGRVICESQEGCFVCSMGTGLGYIFLFSPQSGVKHQEQLYPFVIGPYPVLMFNCQSIGSFLVNHLPAL